MSRSPLAGFVTMVLNTVWYCIAIAMLLTTCIALLSPWMHLENSRIDIPVSFDVDARTVQVTARALGVGAAQIQHVRGSMSFPPPSRASVSWPMALVAVMLALVLWVLSQLIAVFRSLRDRQPFVP